MPREIHDKQVIWAGKSASKALEFVVDEVEGFLGWDLGDNDPSKLADVENDLCKIVSFSSNSEVVSLPAEEQSIDASIAIFVSKTSAA
jgi:hypothetical protein